MWIKQLKELKEILVQSKIVRLECADKKDLVHCHAVDIRWIEIVIVSFMVVEMILKGLNKLENF